MHDVEISPVQVEEIVSLKAEDSNNSSEKEFHLGFGRLGEVYRELSKYDSADISKLAADKYSQPRIIRENGTLVMRPSDCIDYYKVLYRRSNSKLLRTGVG